MFSKGFTIIEVVVAIFILSVALIGVYNAFSIMVILTADTTDRLTAAYLAQEGMEIVRNIRDDNWIAGDDWKAGLIDANINCANGCEADYTTETAVQTPFTMRTWPTGGNYLNINAKGFYRYDTAGEETKFKRKITITSVSLPNCADCVAKVSVQVSWDEKPTILSSGCHAGDDTCMPISSNYITAEEYLYNWY